MRPPPSSAPSCAAESTPRAMPADHRHAGGRQRAPEPAGHLERLGARAPRADDRHARHRLVLLRADQPSQPLEPAAQIQRGRRGAVLAQRRRVERPVQADDLESRGAGSGPREVGVEPGVLAPERRRVAARERGDQIPVGEREHVAQRPAGPRGVFEVGREAAQEPRASQAVGAAVHGVRPPSGRGRAAGRARRARRARSRHRARPDRRGSGRGAASGAARAGSARPSRRRWRDARRRPRRGGRIPQAADVELRVARRPGGLAAELLALARSADALRHGGRARRRGCGQIALRRPRDRHEDVEAVHERPAEAAPVALVSRSSQRQRSPSPAWPHGHGFIAATSMKRAGNTAERCPRTTATAAVLQRLAQRLEHVPRELGQLVEEEHAAVGQRHLARPRQRAAADERRRPRSCGAARGTAARLHEPVERDGRRRRGCA